MQTSGRTVSSSTCPSCGGAGGGPFGRVGGAWDTEDYVCPRCRGTGILATDLAVALEAASKIDAARAKLKGAGPSLVKTRPRPWPSRRSGPTSRRRLGSRRSGQENDERDAEDDPVVAEGLHPSPLHVREKRGERRPRDEERDDEADREGRPARSLSSVWRALSPSNTVAAPSAGSASKNENSAAVAVDRPVSWAVTMVDIERDVPGQRAALADPDEQRAAWRHVLEPVERLAVRAGAHPPVDHDHHHAAAMSAAATGMSPKRSLWMSDRSASPRPRPAGTRRGARRTAGWPPDRGAARRPPAPSRSLR